MVVGFINPISEPRAITVGTNIGTCIIVEEQNVKNQTVGALHNVRLTGGPSDISRFASHIQVLFCQACKNRTNFEQTNQLAQIFL